jgi:hypothetical protein
MAAGITRITIEGYKSIVKEQSIEIAPLTILAGANSSGKSSMIQPLLLLKQTLEAPFDPGPLLINGPTLKFTSSDQFLSGKGDAVRALRVSIDFGADRHGRVRFVKELGELREAVTTDLMQSTDRARVFWPSSPVRHEITRLIHVRGLRGNPERTYPITAVGETFPGVFDNYVASIIYRWHLGLNDDLALNRDLKHLELGGSVLANRVNESELELMVQATDEGDLFNIADVGFGVSQALPALVALRVAKPEQMVYIEQPELHLHPRAQNRMADVLVSAAKRGVRVVVETHSTLLLTSIQTLVAKKELPAEIVRLHWFQRDPRTGVTEVTPALLDQNGAFGDWPADFDDVVLSTDKEYLDAVESRTAG